jgi:tRNA G10  N-methylase Trm11
MSSSLYCLLGNTPALSLLELETLFPGQVSQVLPSLASITPHDSATVNPQLLLDLTGGTFKVLEEIGSWSAIAVDEAGLIDWISEYLHTKAPKPEFGIHCIGFNEQIIDDTDIKKALKAKNSSSRFVDSSATGISSALFLHHPEIFDLLVIKVGGEVKVLKTAVVQNIDDWTNRDRNKPYADRKKGMLPPKVARMMVIIGLGLTYQQHTDPAFSKSLTLLDPFCGTGTVVMEAATLGFATYGSDSSQETIAYAQDNMEWLTSEYTVAHPPQLFTADATSSALTARVSHKIDIIVTEPFLGKPKADLRQLPDIYKGLEKLYLGAFKRWRSILKPKARVAIVFPTVDTGKRQYSLESLIDKLADLGYTIASGPVEYARLQATTRRHIYVFEYTQS